MEFIFSFGPCGNLVVLVLAMAMLFFAMGGLFTLAGNFIKRMRKQVRHG